MPDKRQMGVEYKAEITYWHILYTIQQTRRTLLTPETIRSKDVNAENAEHAERLKIPQIFEADFLVLRVLCALCV